MKFLHIWPWSKDQGRAVPECRALSRVRLKLELLEDRLVPSTSTTDAAYQLWRQQTFKVDDQAIVQPLSAVTTTSLAAQASQPQNASFGSMIGLPSVFANTSYRGDGYSVAVIDTGIDYNNPNLGGGFGTGHRVIAGYNFVNNTTDPMDDNGHGTHVAGIIGSSDATYSGIAPNVNLIALKVLDASGSGTFGNVLNALDWVVANRAKYNIVAINLSLGSGNYTINPYTFMDSDLSALKNSGVFVSVAAGNSFFTNNSQQGLDYPAIDPYVVSVGAVYDGNYGSVAWGSGARDYTTATDRIASFSQRSSALSIMAPGAMITSTYLHNTFQSMAGTSMASPVIAASAVLIHQAMDAKHMTANEDTILKTMQSTGVTVVDGDDENDNVVNTGLSFKRIDLSAAINAIGLPSNPNTPPVLQAISNQTVAPGSTLVVSLNGSTSNGNPITYSASILNGGSSSASNSLAYQLRQQLGLRFNGSYFPNVWGKNEKWMTSTTGNWYCILPDGSLYRWTGSISTTFRSINLIATLDVTYYNDPSLLWNAQPGSTSAPTLTITGNQLTIKAPASATGSYQIQVTASDGKLTASQTFTLSIQNRTAPVINTIASQTMLNNRSLAISLSTSGGGSGALSYTARVVGTSSTLPASLVVSGNQLMIYSSPDFTGGFDVQVTANDGVLSSSMTFHVTVSASAIASRLSADFNGDGRQDIAFLNQDGSWWVSLNRADGTFVNQSWGQWSPGNNWKLVQAGDFNGDGKMDVVGFSNGGSWTLGTSTGTGFNSTLGAQWSAASDWSLVQVGDFNGDGKSDIIGFSNRGSWWVGVSDGTAFTTQLWSQWSDASHWSSVQVVDLNNNGQLGIAGYNNDIKKWYVGNSNGHSFVLKAWTGTTPPVNQGGFSSPSAGNQHMQLADVPAAMKAWFDVLGEWRRWTF